MSDDFNAHRWISEFGILLKRQAADKFGDLNRRRVTPWVIAWYRRCLWTLHHIQYRLKTPGEKRYFPWWIEFTR